MKIRTAGAFVRPVVSAMHSLVFKNILMFVAILTVVVVPIAYTYLNSVERLLTDRLAAQVEVVAQRGSAILDPGVVASITDPAQANTPQYAQLRATLNRIQDDFQIDNAVLYRRLPDQKYAYIADGSGNFAINEHVELHDNFPDTYTAANEAWDSGDLGKTKLFSSEDTKWFQTNVPIKRNGQVVALLLINKFATPVAVEIRRQQRMIIAGVSLVAVLGIVAWGIFTTRILKPLRQLRKAASIISTGELNVEIATYTGRDEVRELNAAFSQMVADLKTSRVKLEEYNRTLEARIEERTREIRNLLDNTDEGIFSIDPNGIIQPGWSAAADKMLGGIGPGTDFVALLETDPAKQATIRQTFDLLFNPSIHLEWEDMTRFLPRDFQSQTGRWMRARFLPLLGSDGQRLAQVMVMLADVTRIRLLREEADRSKAWQDAVVKVLQNRETYDQFNQDAGELLKQSRAQLAGLAVAEPEAVASLFRAMHTLKGTAALFGLESAAASAHEAETLFSELRATPHGVISDEQRTALLDRLNALEQELAGVRQKMDELFGQGPGEPTLTVTYTKLNKVEADILPWIPASRRVLAKTILESLGHIPAPRLLRKYISLVESTSAKLGKSAQLTIEDPDNCELSMEFFKQVDPALLHMLRNALDHGIETPEEREQSGKSPVAKITITVRKYADSIGFKVSDDGHGIDVERIRQVGVERGFIRPDAAAQVPAEDVVKLIFAPGFSSADTITDLSGRGVGMDAVRATLAAMHGRLRLATSKGKGTTIEMIFPLPQVYQLAG